MTVVEPAILNGKEAITLMNFLEKKLNVAEM